MDDLGIEPDDISYNALMNALAKAVRPPPASSAACSPASQLVSSVALPKSDRIALRVLGRLGTGTQMR